jgi:Domain of unknown function (DUF3291)
VAAFGDLSRTVVNWSVWASLAAFRAFTYDGAHLAAMRDFRDRFVRPTEPHLACWWLPAGERVTPASAYDRLDHLRRHGPGPASFPLDAPYPAGALS